jgi:hypothetical protein
MPLPSNHPGAAADVAAHAVLRPGVPWTSGQAHRTGGGRALPWAGEGGGLPRCLAASLQRPALSRHSHPPKPPPPFRQPATLPSLPQVLLLPLFSELAVLCPAATITVVMVGPLGIALPPPISFEGARGGRVTISVLRGLYHDLALPSPDLAIAPNAGLAIAGYETRWPATLRHLQQRATPFVFSDYSEQGVEKGLAFALYHAAMVPSCGVQLNPFRAPMRLSQVHGGSVGHPTLSNGFFAAFNTPPTAFDPPE